MWCIYFPQALASFQQDTTNSGELYCGKENTSSIPPMTVTVYKLWLDYVEQRQKDHKHVCSRTETTRTVFVVSVRLQTCLWSIDPDAC